MRSKLRAKVVGHALALVATVLLGGLISATLVRLAPGFDADEQELDPHLSAASVQACGQPGISNTTYSISTFLT